MVIPTWRRLLANLWRLRKVIILNWKAFIPSTELCFTADWMEIRTNNMIVITPKMNLLQIPIVDEFYVPPSDPAAPIRTTSFAEGKGFLSTRIPVDAGVVHWVAEISLGFRPGSLELYFDCTIMLPCAFPGLLPFASFYGNLHTSFAGSRLPCHTVFSRFQSLIHMILSIAPS